MKIGVKGENVSYKRVHASQVKGSEAAPDWLGASVVEGASQIVIETGEKGGSARLRLYLTDLDDKGKIGQRKFDVELQGKKILEGLDRVEEAGAKTVLVTEFPVEL